MKIDYDKAQSKKRQLTETMKTTQNVKIIRQINNLIAQIDLAIEQASKNGTLINAPKTLDQAYAKTVL